MTELEDQRRRNEVLWKMLRRREVEISKLELKLKETATKYAELQMSISQKMPIIRANTEMLEKKLDKLERQLGVKPTSLPEQPYPDW